MRVRPTILCATLVVASAACTPVEMTQSNLDESVGALLDRGAAAWNRGDLDGFVSTYANEPTTSFISGGRVQAGFDWIRDHYAPRFEPGAARDSLRFQGLAVRALGKTHALATAHYVLFRGDSTTDTGIFTLVLRRDGRTWRMRHDHTSH